MGRTPVVMDGVTYHVGILFDPPLEESFRIEDGPNADVSLAGTDIRDIRGTYYDHTFYVEKDPAYPDDYTAFFRAISAPVDSHTVVMPHDDGDIIYSAKVLSGTREYHGRLRGRRIWKGLKIQLKATAPQRVPGGDDNG